MKRKKDGPSEEGHILIPRVPRKNCVKYDQMRLLFALVNRDAQFLYMDFGP